MEVEMQIAIVVLLSLILVSNLFILAKASRLNPKKFMELFTTQNAESVETAIITELIRYNGTLDCLQELNLKTKGATLSSLLNKEFIAQDLWRKLFNLQKGQII